MYIFLILSLSIFMVLGISTSEESVNARASSAPTNLGGLIGGRRNQERKRERLREAGVAEEAIARISGPCGLDIGADSVPETALSILAEAMAARNGRAGGPLASSNQRIHA